MTVVSKPPVEAVGPAGMSVTGAHRLSSVFGVTPSLRVQTQLLMILGARLVKLLGASQGC